MKRFIVLLVMLLLASLSFAQAPPAPPAPAPDPQPNDGVTVTAGINYTLLSNGPGNSINVTKLDVALPVTDRISLIYNQYIIPSAQANVFIGGARYSVLLSQLFKNTGSFKLDPTKFRLYGDIGVGTRHDSISNVRTGFAGAISGGISYNPMANLSLTLEGGYIRTGAVTGATGVNAGRNFLFGTSPMIAPGVKLSF